MSLLFSVYVAVGKACPEEEVQPEKVFKDYTAPKPSDIGWIEGVTGFGTVNRRLYGEIIGRQVLSIKKDPSAYLDYSCQELCEYFEYQEKKPFFRPRRFKVKTFDGAALDTLEIERTGDPSVPTIIYFRGVGGSYTKRLDPFIEDTKQLNCHTVIFDYRGINQSGNKVPCSLGDLIVDGIAQVQYQLNKGVLPGNIILYGHSLGGLVATVVAKYFQRQGKEIYLFADRPCTSIVKTAKHFFNQQGTTSGKMYGILSGSLLSSGWEVKDFSEMFYSLSKNHREYIGVDGDKTIPSDLSLYEDPLLIKEREKEDPASSPKRKLSPTRPTSVVHNEPLCCLTNEKGQTGLELLSLFGERARRQVPAATADVSARMLKENTHPNLIPPSRS